MQITPPALFDAADKISDQSQRQFLIARGTEFTLLIISAGFGEIPRDSISDIGPWIAVVAFTLALAIRISAVGDNSEKRWYDARAAAESIKSSTWQFAVGGGAFPLSDIHAAEKFREELRRILGVLPRLDIPAAPGIHKGVTREMLELRSESQGKRSDSYQQYRVLDQLSWYSKKAKINREKARHWRWLLIVIEGLAVLLGILRTLGYFDVNWLGIMAAAAAGIAAWQQIKNYSSLSEAYAVTSQEIAIVSETIKQSDQGEDTWAEIVRDAEAAFSREHTLWLARRAGPVRTT